MGQRFTYTQIVFGSIAFKLFNLGQPFWVAFHKVPQASLQQSTPTTWCCHPRASRLGWCSKACRPPLFPSKHNDGHYGQTILFLFHQTRGHFSTKYDLFPHVQLQTAVWLFYGGFGAVASSLLSRLSGYVDIGHVFTVDIDTFVPVSSSIFTRSFAVVLGLICTFRSPKYVHL